ncbi:MAG: ATP phosphoribosyltransferase [Bacteroidota bacterium]
MNRLKIAVQKSGRLSEKSIALLSECGIHFPNGNRRLVSISGNFPVEILFLRDDDIPQYVADMVADIGIVGENVVLEKQKNLPVAERLGFAKCRLSLAIPKSAPYDGPGYFNGKKIATSYPRILQEYLKKHAIDAEIHEISGSVEIAPGIGLAEAIFDIVSTGSTLISNGLKEVETVMQSEAIMVTSPDLETGKKEILGDLIFRMKAVQRAKNNKYILLNAPNDNLEKIVNILPGMKSPTIMPLASKGWSSLHSVVNENDFWDVIGKLKDLGAQGILVIPIEKMII